MDEKIKKCSYEVRPFTEEERTKSKRCADDILEYIRVGPQGYVLSTYWLKYAEEQRKMPLRPSDVWVVTYPRSGTTWTQELVWLINNDLNFERAKAVPLNERYPFLEFYMVLNEIGIVTLKDCKDEKFRNIISSAMIPAHEILANTPSPRFIKSHQPLSLLPEGCLDTCKVVYVARDPRDVAVSCYYFYTVFKAINLHCEFKEFLDLFMNDLSLWSPFFEHLKEAWAQRDHPNMLFLFYEELSKDLKSAAKRVADFFGKTYTDDQLDQLCEHLAFKNFQNNKSVSEFGELGNILIHTKDGDDVAKNFVRKGKAGGWRDYFDEEMSAQARAWMQRNLQDTDLRFPHQELVWKNLSLTTFAAGKAGGWRDYFDEKMSAQARAWMRRNLQDTDLRFPHQEL